MLAMQSNNVISASNQATGPSATNSTPAMSSSSGANPQTRPENAQDKLRRLMVGGAAPDLTCLALGYLGRSNRYYNIVYSHLFAVRTL